MCGIAGYIGFKNDELIKQMSKDMEHRGPDGDGFFINDTVSLLSRRLAIIDRAGGDQPIYNEDKSIVVVFNGEIYNYKELREELEAAGHTFTTLSDTETIVHGYEEWGDDVFNKLNGMFGIALYDMKRERVVVVRDHFGIKPIYFSFLNDSSLIFASEIKPLLNSGLVEKKPNDRIIYRYLRFRIHDDNEETFFAGINRLMPGELMSIQRGVVEKKYYSSLEKDLMAPLPTAETSVEDKKFTKEDIQQFKELLIDSVKRRLVAEVPVGTCLSGGLDSSTVVAIVNQLLQEHAAEAESVGIKQNAFSAVFPGSVNDEEKYIDAVIKQSTDINSIKVFPKPEEFFNDLQDFIKTQEEPTISTGPYAQYQVMREAHKHVTVLLDGQGADEMMAGYLPYYFVYLKQLEKEGKWWKLMSEVFSSFDVLFKFGIFKLKRTFSIQQDVQVNDLLNSNFVKTHTNERFDVINDDLKKRLAQDIFHNSLQSLLRYEDKNTMRFSIEGRVPFLDFRLLQLLFSLPAEAIIKNGWNKYILRQAVDKLLPSMITKRRNKIGFTTPEHEWFLRMKNKIYSIFLSESFATRPYFNQRQVLNAFQGFIEGKSDDTLVFWRMLNVELWLREFFDENPVFVTNEQKEKGYFDPNEGKQISIEVEGSNYLRYPIRTDLFEKDHNVADAVAKYVKDFFAVIKSLKNVSEGNFHTLTKKEWFVIISEKIVAISQGRSYFIWDIKPGFWANFLSKHVTRTPYGIGLGSPWTMQIAIDEVGILRILVASFVAMVTKPFGKKGMFYHMVGQEVAAIDGPTEYSLFPSNVSAKLGPKEPYKVAKHIHEYIVETMKENPELLERFQGVVIIDANDLGRNVLGNSTKMEKIFIETLMRDNPMGQSNEQTPVVMAFKE